MKRTRANATFRCTLDAVVVTAILIAFGAGAARAYERDETLRKRIPLEGAKHIIVMNSRGDVKVIGEKGRGEIACEYTKRIRSRDQDEANRMFDLMDIEVEREGAVIKVSARYPDRSDSNRSIFAVLAQRYTGISIDMSIMVPSGLDVKIVTASGDVQLASILGAGEITAASGDIEVSGVGELKVDVSSGDIVVSSVTGDASLSSASGDIEAHHIKGDALVRSSSGDITLYDIGGDLTASSISGDVEVEGVRGVVFSGTNGSVRFVGVRGGVKATVASGDVEVGASPESNANYEIRTSSGEIELRFERPMKGGFALKAQTTSGDIQISLPITVTKVSRHYLAGIVREGKSVVVLETASGDITAIEPEE
jgi:DUF4097 and DUF4098 domain-containing protein YvlB